MAYLDKDAFANLTVMPSARVDALESVAPDWIDAQLAQESAWIDSRLRKRYAVPFTEPVPAAVQGWLARIVTVRCYLKGGVDSLDSQFEEIKADAEAARAEVLEAANSSVGLFDLDLGLLLNHGIPHSYQDLDTKTLGIYGSQCCPSVEEIRMLVIAKASGLQSFQHGTAG